MSLSAFRTTAIAAAVTALAAIAAGPAQAAFVLGPFAVTQVVEAGASRNGAILGVEGPSTLGSTAPAVSSVSLIEGTFDAFSATSHGAYAPSGNRVFSVSVSGAGDEGLAETMLNYGWTFTNTSASSFTGSINFLVWGLALSNRCLVDYGCDDTDPNAVAGLDIDITTTRPGAVVTEQSLHVELGAGGLLSVLDDDFGVASSIVPSVASNEVHLLDTSPVRLRVNLGTVAAGETVSINYDTRAYTSSNDGTCQPEPITVVSEECVRFEEVPIDSSGGSGASTTRVCVETRPVVMLIPRAPERCTIRQVSLVDPLDNQSSEGLSLQAATQRIPVTGTLALLAPALLGLGFGLRQRHRRSLSAVRLRSN